MIRAFNTECEASINKLKYTNLTRTENRIRNAFKTINKSSAFELCSISDYYLDLKLEEMRLGFEYELKREEEKEILRIERMKRNEEKKLQEETREKKKILNKEIGHLNKIIRQLEKKLAEANELNKKSLEEELMSAKNNKSKLEDDKKELDYRIEHVGAGYVYIISNIGAFGEEVFKIGVTRRLDPYERIAELSTASVPFKFDVHAMIFSYQAYKLETELHKRFFDKRINLVNNRKEFFNITMEEIKMALEEHKELTFDFKEVPSADEYRETLKLREKERVFN